MSVCQLKRQEGESGGAFFHPQVWQSNSSLETCKVSRETNWPFDTAEACIMSRETFESRLSRTFIITILLTSQKPTLMLKLQHRPNSFKHSWIPITYMYIKRHPSFHSVSKSTEKVSFCNNRKWEFLGPFSFTILPLFDQIESPLTHHWKNYGSL